MNEQNTPGGNPFAPPTAEVADRPATTNELATRGARLFAAVLDGLLLLALVLPLFFLTPLRGQVRDESFGSLLVMQTLSFVIFLATQGYLLVRDGQTWGKKFRGLRIVRSDGSRVAPARLLGLRYGTGFLISAIPGVASIWGLIDSLFIYRASHRCLHDSIADTIVVNA